MLKDAWPFRTTPAPGIWYGILLMVIAAQLWGGCPMAFAQAQPQARPQTQPAADERSAHDKALLKAVREAVEAHYAFTLTAIYDVTDEKRNELFKAQNEAIGRMFRFKPNDVDGPSVSELFRETDGEKSNAAWSKMRTWFDDAEDLFIEADRIVLEPDKKISVTAASVQMGYVTDRYEVKVVVVDEPVTVKTIILGPGAILSIHDHTEKLFDVPTRDGTFVLTVEAEARVIQSMINLRDRANGLAEHFSRPEFVDELQAGLENRSTGR